MTFSVMFHHFHSDFHRPAQGSLGPDDFFEMLTWLVKRYNILDAGDYSEKFLSGSLEETDICLSFDDALRCQYDVAMPILKEFDLKAFFFIHSSAFSNDPDPLEIYRYFRTSEFSNVDDFYDCFFERLIQTDNSEYKKHQAIFESLKYLKDFPFYTNRDKWFRYLRDQYLGSENYDRIMKAMMDKKEFDASAVRSILWMSKEQLLDLHTLGHTIGLHSYSHPTQMGKLTKVEQLLEYQKNFQHLEGLLGPCSISSMSHPCGNYNNETLEILRDMGIKIGFRSNMGIKEIKSSLEIPREDHANIFREMR